MEQGLSYYKAEQYADAIAAFDHLIQLTPITLGQYEEAVAAYDQAIRLAPNVADAIFYVLRTGCQWQGLDKFLPCTSRTRLESLLILQRNLIVCCGIIATTGMFRGTSPFTSPFGLCARAIDALGHFLNRLHHLFQHRFLLEEDNLACSILKGFFCDIQAFIH